MDSLSSLSRELVDVRRLSSELHGAIRPPSQRPGVSSHRQRFAAASAGPSVSRRRPYDFASGQPTSNSSGRSFRPGGDSPPHKRRTLPDENSSDDERESSAGHLLPDKEEGDEENCRPASLALLLDFTMSKFPAASKPLARPSNRLQTKIRLNMAAIRLQVSCNRTKRRVTRRIVALPPWRCCLTAL